MTEIFSPFEVRKDAFHEEYRLLVEKYKVDFIALLQPTQNSINAILGFVDLAPKTEDKDPSSKTVN